MQVPGRSSAAFGEYLSALAGGHLASMDADEAYGLLDEVASDPAGLAESFGFSREEGEATGRPVVVPLLDKYLSVVARDDGGAFSLVTEAASRDAGDDMRSVSDTLGVPEESVAAAVSGLADGRPAAFDRMMADYYGT